MKLFRNKFRKLFAIVVASGLTLFPPLALAQTAPQVPSYTSAANRDFEQFSLSPLTISTTTQNVNAIGHSGIITSIVVGAITPPSAASDVSVQFFKNNLSTAMTGVYDLHNLTAGISTTIPITGNQYLAPTDLIICQVVCGASIGAAVGCTATACVSATTYSNGTSF